METFSDFRLGLKPILWPTGEAYNLVSPHRSAFVEAFIDLQKWVNCLQFNNVSIYSNCGQLFQCGQTVVTAPEGNIFSVSTFDRINRTTGVEDADAAISWCSEVRYHFIEYCRLRKIVDEILCAHRACFPSPFPLSCGYPVPTNAGYDSYPELPLGFQYPQASLDRTGTCVLGGCTRASTGVWALENGRIYLAPWLQSTEVLAVQWNGIKRAYTDADLINDAPDYKEAVKFFVWWVHYRDYMKDPEMAAMYKGEYERVRAFLIRDCRERTRDHACEPSLAQASLTTLMAQSEGFITAVPNPPINLQAYAVSTAQVNLVWTDVSLGRNSFIIERLVGSVWTVIGTAPAGTTVFYDAGRTAGTEYCYRVIATNDEGDSVPTEQVCTTTPAANYNPNDYSNWRHGWDSDHLVVSGANVQQALDQNALAVPFVQATSTAPQFVINQFNGHPSVRFLSSVGTEMISNVQALIANNNYTQFWTIALVAKRITETARQVLLTQTYIYPLGGAGPYIMGISTSESGNGNKISAFAGQSGLTLDLAVDTTETMDGEAYIVVATWDGTNIKLWRNGTLRATTPFSLSTQGAANNSQAMFLGGAYPTRTFIQDQFDPANIDWAHLDIWNAVLSNANIAQIFTRLNSLYDVY